MINQKPIDFIKKLLDDIEIFKRSTTLQKNINESKKKRDTIEQNALETFQSKIINLKIMNADLPNLAENVLSEFKRGLLPAEWFDNKKFRAVIFEINHLVQSKDVNVQAAIKDCILKLFSIKKKGIGAGEVALPLLLKDYQYVNNTSKESSHDGLYEEKTTEVKVGGGYSADKGNKKASDSKLTDLNQKYWGGDKLPGQGLLSVESHMDFCMNMDSKAYAKNWEMYINDVYNGLLDSVEISKIISEEREKIKTLYDEEKYKMMRNNSKDSVEKITDKRKNFLRENYFANLAKKKDIKEASDKLYSLYKDTISDFGKKLHKTMSLAVIKSYMEQKKMGHLIIGEPEDNFNIAIINDVSVLPEVFKYIKSHVVLIRGKDTQATSDGYAVVDKIHVDWNDPKIKNQPIEFLVK